MPGTILRVHIDGQWSADDMVNSLQEFVFLYDFRLYLDWCEDFDDYYFYLPRPPRKRWYPFPMLGSADEIRRFARQNLPQYALNIRRIEYASPGKKELKGEGGAIGAVFNFVRFLIEYFGGRHEEQTLRNNSQRIQNARDFVQLQVERQRADVELLQLERERLLEQETLNLVRLIQQGKIIHVELLEDEDDGE